MKIGITFDLKGAPVPAGAPDDLFEEFDEPATVAAIAEVLRGLGHQPIELGNGPEMVRRLVADPPDFVFNFAEGQGVSRSREARVPAICETLGIPYTGSDPATLSVCLDKDWARRLVESVGVPTPPAMTVFLGPNLPDDFDTWLRRSFDDSGLELPVIAKPALEGSSKGVRRHCLVHRPGDLASVVADLARTYRQPILIEEFIDGDEVTVGVIGNDPPEVLGLMRIIPNNTQEPFVYSLEVKRDWRNQVRYEVPARLPAPVEEAVREAALNTYEALGCRDVARIDFRLRDGTPYFIEANPLPGLHPEHSDLVILARGLGMSHAQLIERILMSAIHRTNC
jgi:D-alanine-D-alanine ligase